MSESRISVAGEYVLGTLDLNERREFERRLGSDPVLRAQVADWEHRLLALAATAPPVDMPQSAWTPLQVLTEARPRADNVVPFKLAPARRRFAAAMVGALAASIAGIVVFRSFDGAPSRVAPVQVQASPPSASASAPGQPSLAVANSTPCAVDPQQNVQVAKGSAEPSAPNGGVSPSLSTASGVAGNGGVVLGGGVAVAPGPRDEGKDRAASACPPPPGR